MMQICQYFINNKLSIFPYDKEKVTIVRSILKTKQRSNDPMTMLLCMVLKNAPQPPPVKLLVQHCICSGLYYYAFLPRKADWCDPAPHCTLYGTHYTVPTTDSTLESTEGLPQQSGARVLLLLPRSVGGEHGVALCRTMPLSELEGIMQVVAQKGLCHHCLFPKARTEYSGILRQINRPATLRPQ